MTDNVNEQTEVKSFEMFGLRASINATIDRIGFKVPSPIQVEAIPFVLAGRDLIGQANTGTGKTAAFGLPLVNMIKKGAGTQVLIITPTRELAVQITDELFNFGKDEGLRTLTIYGSQSYKRQIDALRAGTEVVVATPGRMLDLLKKGSVGDFKPSIVVLDEADEMLDMGFLTDIRNILTFLPAKHQTLLFSATMPQQIKKLAEEILKDPVHVNVMEKNQATNKDIKEVYCVMDERERDDATIRLLDSEEPDKVLIFCRTKREVDRLSGALNVQGYLVGGLHGDMEQNQRRRVIDGFTAGSIKVLVATDVAARGLDIQGITHVINFHIPFEAQSYVHRIGRTGRAGNKGIAITLVTPRELRDLVRIKKTLGLKMDYYLIPTLTDLKGSGMEKLVAEVVGQSIGDAERNVFDLLKKEGHVDDIAQKLIAYILRQEQVKGPESIGLSQDRALTLINNIKSSGGGNGGFRRGGFRRGGGGGGRGGFHRGGHGGGGHGGGFRRGGGGHGGGGRGGSGGGSGHSGGRGGERGGRSFSSSRQR